MLSEWLTAAFCPEIQSEILSLTCVLISNALIPKSIVALNVGFWPVLRINGFKMILF